MIRFVTVYCSSSRHINPAYLRAGEELGRAIAAKGWSLVYGGNNVGMMGVLADAGRAGGARVVGVTPKLFVDKGVCDHGCDELIITDGMRERKAIMEARGDAFIALPGGLGTFEEIFEIIVGKQLAYHDKPIVLLSILNFWSPLMSLIEQGIEQKFVRRHVRDLFHVAETVEEAVKYVAEYRPAKQHAALSFETSRAFEVE